MGTWSRGSAERSKGGGGVQCLEFILPFECPASLLDIKKLFILGTFRDLQHVETLFNT